MVSFSCSQCGDTIKKKKAEHHLYQCRSAVLSCVDCGREFRDGTYAEHYSCVTEAQKYEKPGTQFEQPKGEKVQMTWFENVQAACRSSKCSPKCQQLLKQLQDFPNTPRRKDKFMNFVGNSIRGFRTEHVEEAWNIIAECSSKNRSQNGDPKCNQQGSGITPTQHENDQTVERHDKHSAPPETREAVNSTGTQEEAKPCDDVNGVVKKKHRKKDKREVWTEDISCREEAIRNDGVSDSADKTKKEKKKRHKICEQVTGDSQPDGESEAFRAEGNDQNKDETIPDEEAATSSKKKHRKHKHSNTKPEEYDPPTSSKRKRRHNAEHGGIMNETLPRVEDAQLEDTRMSHENGSKNKKKKHKKMGRVDSSDGQMLTTNC